MLDWFLEVKWKHLAPTGAENTVHPLSSSLSPLAWVAQGPAGWAQHWRGAGGTPPGRESTGHEAEMQPRGKAAPRVEGTECAPGGGTALPCSSGVGVSLKLSHYAAPQQREAAQ